MQKYFFVILFTLAINICCSAQFTFEKNYFLNGYWNKSNTGFVSLNTTDSGYYLFSWNGDSSIANNFSMGITRLDKKGDVLWNKESDKYSVTTNFGLGGVLQFPDSSIVMQWDDQYSARTVSRGGLIHTDKYGNAIWGKKYFSPTNTEDYYINNIARTLDNGIITWGSCTSISGPITDYVVLMKTDSSGNLKWCKEYVPDSSYEGSQQNTEITLTADSGFLLTFGGIDTATLNSLGYLMKADKNGNVVWLKKYYSWLMGFTRPLIENGGIYLDGYDVTENYTEVMKTDTLGNPLWAYSYLVSGTTPYDEISDKKGNEIIAIDYGFLNFNSCIFKIDSTGNVLWANSYGSANSLGITKLNLQDDGGFVGNGYNINGNPFSYSPANWRMIKTDYYGRDGCESPFNITKQPVVLSYVSIGCQVINVTPTVEDTLLNFSAAPIDTTTPCALEPFTSIATIGEQKDTICNGYCLCFADNSLNTPTSWKWYFSGAIPDSSISQNPCNICYSSPGTYSVIFIASNAGGADTAYGSVTVIAQPLVTISGKDTICPNDSTTLTASPNSLSYLWSTPNSNQSITVAPISDTYYYIQVSNGYCLVKDSMEVIVKVFNPAACCDASITPGQSVNLDAAGGTQYIWNPHTVNCDTCPNTASNPIQTTIYTVSISNNNGCSATKTITIDVSCGQIFIPTAFSPNEPNNSILYVRGPCIATMNFDVFDRWGNKVFESQNPDKGWDGTYKGQPLNMGTYVWYLDATLQDGTSIARKGNVNLIR